MNSSSGNSGYCWDFKGTRFGCKRAAGGDSEHHWQAIEVYRSCGEKRIAKLVHDE